MPSDPPLERRSPLPERLGAYRIESLLGAGGMGVVYRATAPDGTLVAVKTLGAQAMALQQQGRFAREASIRIDHPNVIRVLDTGTDASGTPYIVLELLAGRGLDARLKEGALAPADLVPIALQATAGLSAVHAAGIVHRDLKPANLFLCDDGTVKVLDFGIAQVGGTTKLTADGAVLGSISYLAPEQARGVRTLGPATDVWALGVVLFEALTGALPFDRESAVATLLAIIQDAPPALVGRRRDAPNALVDIVERCLRKSPAERYATAAELRTALASVPLDRGRIDAGATAETLEFRLSLPPGEQRVVVVLLARRATDSGLVVKAIEAFGGEAVPILGSDVIGLFGNRSWEGDEAVRAVEAALRCRGSAAAIAVGSGRAHTVATGLAGAALLEAERGCSAHVDGVAISTEIARALGGRFETRQIDTRLLEVTGRKRTSSLAAPEPGLSTLGRELELGRMRAVVEQVRATGTPHVIELTGALGIGKSRVRRELEAHLLGTEPPFEVLEARGEPVHKNAALQLWASLLWRRVRSRGDADPAAALFALVREAVVDPASAQEDAAFLGELLGVEIAASPVLHEARTDPQLMSDRLRLAIVEHIVALSRRGGPLALLLEDLQWVDSASLALLDHVASRVGDAPVLFLVTSRTPILDMDAGAWAAMPVERIELRPLAPVVASQLARAVARRELPEELEKTIVARSEGNPFFVEQMTLALCEQEDLEGIDPGSVPLPPTVEGALQSRLDRLPEGSRAVLRRAAVLGRPFRADEVEALGADNVQASIELLVERDLIAGAPSARRTGATEFALRSALVAEVTYNGLAQEARTMLHLRAADYLATAPEQDLEEAARHYERVDERKRAGECFARAALASARSGDSATVERCAERALALGAPRELLHPMHMAVADALRFLGRRADQAQHLEDALSAARTDTERARTLTEKVSLLWWLGRHAEAVTVAADAVSMARACGEIEPLVRALCRQVDALLAADRPGDAEDALREATAAARDQPPGVRVFVDERRASLAEARGDFGQVLLAWTRVLEQLRSSGLIRRAAGAQQNLADCYNRLGAYQDAETALRDAVETCRRVGNRLHEAYALTNLGYSLTMLGRPDEALEILAVATAIAESMHDARLSICAAVYRATALEVAGRVSEALTDAERAADLAKVRTLASLEVLALTAAARALLVRGEPAEALKRVTRALSLRDPLQGLQEGEGELSLAHVQALAALGRRQEADHVRAEAVKRLRSVAGRIRDAAWRRRYLGDVPAHRALLAQ